jgi:hypothetical protein
MPVDPASTESAPNTPASAPQPVSQYFVFGRSTSVAHFAPIGTGELAPATPKVWAILAASKRMAVAAAPAAANTTHVEMPHTSGRPTTLPSSTFK